MGAIFNGKYTSVSQITGPTGWYNFAIDNQTIPIYVNQDYSGGGWVLVLANRLNTGGMNNLSFYDSIHSANFRTGGSTNGTNIKCVPNSANPGLALSNYNVFLGLKYWRLLSGRQTSNAMTIVQFVANTSGTSLTGSHVKRYRWQSGFFGPTYNFNSVSSINDETGTGSPGLYSYHALNGYNMTTYDMDRDVYGSNCSSLYNNNPWWYGACWSGNYFAGGGYQDGPYWDGSGSDYYQYGAVYIK